MSFKSLSIVAAAALALCAGAAQAQVAGLANGGFEIAANNLTPGGLPSPAEFAEGWQGNQSAPTRTSERRGRRRETAGRETGSWHPHSGVTFSAFVFPLDSELSVQRDFFCGFSRFSMSCFQRSSAPWE